MPTKISVKDDTNNEVLKERIPDTSWDVLFTTFFRNQFISNKKHQKVRKVYSLPVISSPSGGFRIERYNPVKREKVLQVSTIEGFSSMGKSTNLKDTILIAALQRSKKVIPLDNSLKESSDFNILYYDRWVSVKELPQNIKTKVWDLSYSLNSAGRCRIRLTTSSKHIVDITGLNDWREITPQVKVDPAKFLTCFGDTCLGKPRSNLFFIRIGEKVIFEYIVNSNNAAMTKLISDNLTQ
jgi:hypothetical protein